jgi:hypothetical protein
VLWIRHAAAEEHALTRRALPALAFLVLGVAAAWSADGAWWSAAVLLAEPVLLVGVGAALYLLAWRRDRLAFTLTLLAGLLPFVAARLPRTGSPAVATGRAWTDDVANCAGSLPLPARGFTLLQWTIEGDATAAEVLAFMRRNAVDVTVLGGDVPADLEPAGELGGDQAGAADGLEGWLIHTAGVLHLCGENSWWASEHSVLVFAGVDEGTAVPILATRFPSLAQRTEWAAAYDTVREEAASTAWSLRSSLLVVAADARAPWTFGRLDGRFRALGLARVPSPADWPYRAAWGRTLPLHPFDRAWVAEGWQVSSTRRIDTPTGARAAVRTRFEPALPLVTPERSEERVSEPKAM